MNSIFLFLIFNSAHYLKWCEKMPLLLVDTSLVSKVYLGIKMFLAKLRKVIVGINKHYWGREGDICKELILT